MYSFNFCLFFLLYLFVSYIFANPETQEKEHFPEQIRLVLSSDPSTQQIITWVVKTTSEKTLNSILMYTQLTNRIYWAPSSNTINKYSQNCSDPTVWQRKDEQSGFYFHTYVCILKNLIPDTAYSYSIIGDTRIHGKSTSKPSTFITQPTRITPQVIGVVADMGTWPPADSLMDWISSSHDYDLFLHLGDMSYGLDDKTWDLWGNIVQGVSSRVNYQTIPGNWDAKPAIVNSYKQRFLGPFLADHSINSLNYYYSFKFSFGTFIMLSAYDDYEPQSLQYKWFENELIKAQSDRIERPWIIVAIHNPMYSSSKGHGGGDEKVRGALEKLIYDNQVDLLLTGHDHGYERSYPTYDNKPLSDSSSLYQDPVAPIHILAGVGGGTLDEWITPQPTWSAVRKTSHGLVRLSLEYSRLSVEFTGWPSKEVLDYFEIQKDIKKVKQIMRRFNGETINSTSVGLSPFSIFILCLIFFGVFISVYTVKRKPYSPAFPV